MALFVSLFQDHDICIEFLSRLQCCLVYLRASTRGGSSSTSGVRGPTPSKLNRVLGSCAKSGCSNVAWNLLRFSVLQHIPKIHWNIHIQPSRIFSSLGQKNQTSSSTSSVCSIIRKNLKISPIEPKITIVYNTVCSAVQRF